MRSFHYVGRKRGRQRGGSGRKRGGGYSSAKHDKQNKYTDMFTIQVVDEKLLNKYFSWLRLQDRTAPIYSHQNITQINGQLLDLYEWKGARCDKMTEEISYAHAEYLYYKNKHHFYCPTTDQNVCYSAGVREVKKQANMRLTTLWCLYRSKHLAS